MLGGVPHPSPSGEGRGACREVCPWCPGDCGACREVCPWWEGSAGHAGRCGKRLGGARSRSLPVAAAEAERRRRAMLRRKPTRLELKLDDIEEFESIRKDLESRKKQREEAEVAAAGEEAAIALGAEHKSREQLINDRIGYKPQPKAGGRAAHFGTFEF